MAHKLYMDHSVHGAIVRGLRRRGMDVLTAHEDNRREAPDWEIMDRATELERVVFAQDWDFVVEGENRQRQGIHFYGVIYAKQRTPIGKCIEDLEIYAKLEESENLINRVRRIPI